MNDREHFWAKSPLSVSPREPELLARGESPRRHQLQSCETVPAKNRNRLLVATKVPDATAQRRQLSQLFADAMAVHQRRLPSLIQ